MIKTGDTLMKIKSLLVASAVMVAGFSSANVLAVGNNLINPTEGKCNVYLPPTAGSSFSSTLGNKIHYTMDIEDGILKATCHMVDHNFNLDNAIHFTGDDYNFPYICRVRIDGTPYDTPNFDATVTPSGKVKLTCTVDLNAPI